MDYKKSILICMACIVVSFAASTIRVKREAYVLPDGVEAYIPPIKPNFQCSSGGYYADIENNCQLFHVCVPRVFPDGKSEMSQYTFACGNQTVFNQFSMTCAHESESIPCSSSSEFFYLNERIGQEKELLHTDQDVEKLANFFGAREAD